MLQITVICVVLITASYSPVPSKQQLLGVRDGNLGENLQLMAELFPTDREFLGQQLLELQRNVLQKGLTAELGAAGTLTQGVTALVSPSTQDTAPQCSQPGAGRAGTSTQSCPCSVAVTLLHINMFLKSMEAHLMKYAGSKY